MRKTGLKKYEYADVEHFTSEAGLRIRKIMGERSNPSSCAVENGIVRNEKRKNIIQRLTMPLPELEAYYRKRRKDNFENDAPFGGVKVRKVLHPLLVGGMKLKHILSKQKITILGDKRMPTDLPVIYAATHIGWDDIEMILSSIGDHAYLLWGDPRKMYRDINGFLLDINGIVVTDTGDKSDRHIGKETCIKWLDRGGNLLIFPEGAWNITESLPIMPLYTGAAEMAIRTGAEIIPLAIERYGQNYTINIGRNISVSNLTLEQKHWLTETLRDAMASLRWEIWEKQTQAKREEISTDYRLQELCELQEEMHDVYTMDDIEATRFHSKEEIEQRDSFVHLDKLIPSEKNAFLFRK